METYRGQGGAKSPICLHVGLKGCGGKGSGAMGRAQGAGRKGVG